MDDDKKERTLEELQAEIERVQDALKKANAESAGRRKELEKIATDTAEKDKAALSETEKSEARFAAVEAKLEASETREKEQKIRTAIITEATALGFANPEHAFALVDKSEVEITDGSVSGFEKSLQALAESGSLTMADQKRGDSLGTPLGKGKPASGAEKAPVQIRL